MLDAVTLDQLRTFIAAAEEGSFSVAARKLRRAQSVVSQTLANLENQLDTPLFERTGRYPKLTAQGTALLQDARGVIEHMDGFKARAKTLASGLEPELSIVVDVIFPMDVLTEAVGLFRAAFPHTPCACTLKRSVGSSCRCRRSSVRSESSGPCRPSRATCVPNRCSA